MSSSVPRRAALRTAAGALVGAAVAGTLAGCTEDAPTRSADPSRTPTPTRHEVVLHDDARASVLAAGEEPTLAASRALLSRATAVVVTSDGPDDVAAGTTVATGLRLPLLVAGEGLHAELDRLGTRTVLWAAPVASAWASSSAPPSASPSASGSPTARDLGDREVVEVAPGEAPDVPGLPPVRPTGTAVVAAAPGAASPPVLEALLAACGATSLALEAEDPRTSTADATALRRAKDAVVLGVGGLGAHFGQRVRTVRYAPELPGGGYLPFPGRRMVALYGHPRTGSLGMLGEQSAARSVTRVEDLVEQYAPLLDERVVPAFELIATVATGSAGAQGVYSQRTPLSDLTPWVDVAEKAGVYVVLDLQPGRADFLDQARAYEELLRRPHVGLALDPEWRLGPSEKPLQQIGHVGVDEVNRVGRWLAALVREHDLPPKVLTLHQFRTSMIRDRDRLDTSLDEVQWLVHADGQGSQGAKQGTWAALRRDLPEGVWLGWKNFEDEDAPMLTPAQTVAQVRPTPWFVSYQ